MPLALKVKPNAKRIMEHFRLDLRHCSLLTALLPHAISYFAVPFRYSPFNICCFHWCQMLTAHLFPTDPITAFMGV